MFACQWTRVARALLLTALLAVPALNAYADVPTRVTTPTNFIATIPAGAACAFAVQVQLTGDIIDTYQNGVLTMVQFHLTTTFSNPTNGKSISSPTNLTRRNIVFNGDGTATVTDAGIDGVFTVPGAGNIGATVGRGIATIPAWQAPGISPGPATFQFQAGQFTPLFPTACQYLQ